MYDIFLMLSGVPGESQDKTGKRDRGIQIMSWSWGACPASSVAGTGGSGAGKAGLSDFSIMTYFDKAPPWLYGQITGAAGRRRKSSASIVFKNIVQGQAGGQIHRLDIDEATISDAKPYYPPGPRRGPAGLQVTLSFPEYRFNGIRNALIPNTLIPASLNRRSPVVRSLA
jgi:type VI protein secretion system component Hcp